MSEEELGIKDFNEMLDAVMDVAVFLCETFKDGAQGTDVMAIMAYLLTDEKFKVSLQKAIDGAQNIPDEIKDLDAQEGLQIGANILIKHVPRFIEVFKK